MRKSVGITKYEIEWQVLRVSLKGRLNNNLDQKLKLVYDYFMVTQTYDRWERVYNWLEGLQRGFRAHQCEGVIQRIQLELDFYKSIEPVMDTVSGTTRLISDFSIEVVGMLFVDLCKTCKKWLSAGYFHRECNEFIDQLYVYISQDNVKYTVLYEQLIMLRSQCYGQVNKHRFFF